MSDFKKITEQELKEGTKLFEGFWLRPKQYVNKTVPLRLRINKNGAAGRLRMSWLILWDSKSVIRFQPRLHHYSCLNLLTTKMTLICLHRVLVLTGF